MIQNPSLVNRILGRVVAEKSGRGIPDLLVVALDFDAARIGVAIARAADGPDPVRVPPAPQGGVREILAHLERTPFIESAFPQRLGSVLTTADGSFSLQYEDDLFADEDPNGRQIAIDRRPDIILLVLAPDRPSRTGEGMALTDRLLYYTRPIRFESGRTESDVIRIPEARLAEFNIHVGEGDALTRFVTPEQYRAELTRQHDSDKAMLTVRREMFEAHELPRIVEERKTFEKLLPKLVARRAWDPKRFVGLSPSKIKVVEKIWLDVKSLPWLTPANPASAPRSGRVYLTQKDLDRLGLTPATIAAGSGEAIRLGRLLDYIGYSNGPYRNRNLLSQIETKRAIFRLATAPAGGPGGTPPAPAGPAATVDTLRDDVLQRLDEQVHALERPPGKTDPAYDLSRLKQIIDQLEQTSGIANVAAMHDVDVLQVAFEPLWTAVFDEKLKQQAKDLFREIAKEDIQSACGVASIPLDDIESVDQMRDLLSDIVSAARGSGAPHLDLVGKLALDLANRLAEPYSFQYFAPGSTNFGLLQTFRQSWTPITYQVGRLAETIPLAPGESRTLKITRTSRRHVKRTRREKSSLQQLQESASVSRTEIEAMEKTATAMSNQTSVNGGFNVGIGSLSTTTTFSLNQSSEAQRIHKSFAEISRKASQEVRRELEVQVEEETTEEATSEATRTLRNPNDELTVTYLLYELERRYRVSSHIQGVQPVILVALPMPAPFEIDDAWILEHSWVIRDVLLDPDFEEALSILEDSRSRDGAEIAILDANYAAASAVHKKADTAFERLSQQAVNRRSRIVELMEEEKLADLGQASTGQRAAAAIFSFGLSELFGGGQSNEDDILRAKREATQKALEYLEVELSAAAEARDKASAILNSATEKYSAALAAKAMADQKLLQLRLHVRGNIFHYMHEIWRRRDSDDLFFSLYDLEIPFLEVPDGQCRLRKPTQAELDAQVPGVVIDGDLYMVDVHPATVVPDLAAVPKKRLIEVADVDRPLGFKGNYVILPLKTGSLLTDFMTVGFLDGYYGVRDPALNAAYSAMDLLNYAQNVWNDPIVGLTLAQRNTLSKLIADASMRNPGYESEVVLPTGQLFMEALKGDQALLEDFKLAHRGLDVLKVEEEIRQARIENLRRVQRIGMKEPQLGDPDIEKTTVVRGVNGGVLIGNDN